VIDALWAAALVWVENSKVDVRELQDFDNDNVRGASCTVSLNIEKA